MAKRTRPSTTAPANHDYTPIHLDHPDGLRRFLEFRGALGRLILSSSDRLDAIASMPDHNLAQLFSALADEVRHTKLQRPGGRNILSILHFLERVLKHRFVTVGYCCDLRSPLGEQGTSEQPSIDSGSQDMSGAGGWATCVAFMISYDVLVRSRSLCEFEKLPKKDPVCSEDKRLTEDDAIASSIRIIQLSRRGGLKIGNLGGKRQLSTVEQCFGDQLQKFDALCKGSLIQNSPNNRKDALDRLWHGIDIGPSEAALKSNESQMKGAKRRSEDKAPHILDGKRQSDEVTFRNELSEKDAAEKLCEQNNNLVTPLESAALDLRSALINLPPRSISGDVEVMVDRIADLIQKAGSASGVVGVELVGSILSYGLNKKVLAEDQKEMGDPCEDGCGMHLALTETVVVILTKKCISGGTSALEHQHTFVHLYCHLYLGLMDPNLRQGFSYQ